MEMVLKMIIKKPIWFIKSQEYSLSKYSLGFMYEKGYGVEKNIDTAIDWYESASKQEEYNSQFNLQNIL